MTAVSDKESDIHPQSATVEQADTVIDAPAIIMRSADDDLSVWQSVQRYKGVGAFAMAAAFSASLDGYQINLNGGIIANKGFIRQMANPGAGIIRGQYVSAWGGIQSAGQTVGQILLQFATERFGRKCALYMIWLVLAVSIVAESFARDWRHWLVAKLLSGMGVGMLQSTLPLYIAEISPTQLRGLYINAYSLWFIMGQLFASVALNELKAVDPYNFRTPIYTQWAMIGVAAIIFIVLPESPWWLVSKNRLDEAAGVLRKCHGDIENYNPQEHLNIMSATLAAERQYATDNAELGYAAVLRGRNLLRLVICAWPKIVQQFVGLSIFNTYAVYFFQAAGNKNPFVVTVILSAVQLLSMVCVATTTDTLGRRPLTVYPYGVTVLSVLSLGIIGCYDYEKKSTSTLLTFFACLATFSTTGASAIGYAYAAEIPQQRLRAKTTAFALAGSNMIAILFSFCTPIMINGPTTRWGVKTAFFFAGTGAVSVVVAWLLLPEVAKRTPAEIDELFEKRIKLREFGTYITDVELNSRNFGSKWVKESA